MDHVDPMTHPLPGSRALRMKRERHTEDNVTFQPRKPVS
jgi:hypothetical protein